MKKIKQKKSNKNKNFKTKEEEMFNKCCANTMAKEAGVNFRTKPKAHPTEDEDQMNVKMGGVSKYRISYNEEYILFLKNWIKENNIKSVVDLGCGDFKCGKLIYDDLDVSYTGYDAYNKLIEYHQENIQDTKYEFIHKDILLL